MKPVTISGTWDDGASNPFLFRPSEKAMTITFARRFLWWTVKHSTMTATCVMSMESPVVGEDGQTTYLAKMVSQSPWSIALAPWWERALYRIAGLWSTGDA